MKNIRLTFAIALLGALITPALATDEVFPSGVRIGMTPLVGLSLAKTFQGFETEDHSVKVLLAELPEEAYGEVMKAFKANPNGVNGIKAENIETSAGTAYYTVENAQDGAIPVRRYSMIVPGGAFSGYAAVQIPQDAQKIYTDDAVRKMFASVTVRKEVPAQEQLALLPFKVSELSDFKNVRTLAPGAAVIVADADETTGFEIAPFMVIGVIALPSTQPEDRGRMAVEIVRNIPGVRDAKITTSDPMRIDGLAGYETRIDATSGKDNTAVTVVQWLLFDGSNTLRIIGSAPRDKWSAAFTRFRAVRDGIQLH